MEGREIARRAGRAVLYVLAVIVGLVAVAALLLVIATNTDWGRERVRRQVVSRLDDMAHGHVQIGKLGGNLLDGLVATDVSITDSVGAPLLTADTVRANYDLGALLHQQIVLHDVRLVDPLIVLDQRPGEPWNFSRIFPSDTTAPPDTVVGWGDWLRLTDVSIAGGHVIVRMPWEPNATLSGAGRDSAIALAVSSASRARVEPVQGGWQTIYEFRDLNARLPLVRLADPTEPAQLAEVAMLRTDAYPFRPPAAEIRDLQGRFYFTGDSLWFPQVAARLPQSQLTGSGTVVFGGRTELALHTAPLALGDLQWLYPALPQNGRGTLDFAFYLNGDTSRYTARGASITLDSASLAGNFGLLMIGDSLRFTNTDLRFADVGTGLIEQLVPGLDIPRRGTLRGRAALDGPIGALQVNADVAFDDVQTGRSRVLAVGQLGWSDGVFSADSLRVEVRPLQVALAEAVSQPLPIGGVVRGTALVNGSTATRLRARFDLTHRGPTGVSRVVGDGAIRRSPNLMYDIDARLEPLALPTVGSFAAALPLRGSVSGPVTLHGGTSAVRFDADLQVRGGGALAARGTMNFGGAEPTFDVRAVPRAFDASAVLASAPATSLSGLITARGRGFDPATMTATLTADLASSRVDTVGVDSAMARVSVANGLASIDTLALHAPATLVAASGTFGLRPDRVGSLEYLVQVDSLGAYAALLGSTDTTATPPRPRLAARALAAARADSARQASRTEVERMVTGAAPPALPPVDTVPAIARDSVAGAVYARGLVEGNLDRVNVRGVAAVEKLVLRGNAVERARAEYAWINGRTPDAAIVAAVKADSLRAVGLALDSADVRIAYAGEQGSADVVIVQDDTVDYRARANFRLALDDNELLFEQLALRVDTTRWVATHPGIVRWGGRGVRVDSLELDAGEGRRIFVNGLLPTSGAADLAVSVQGLEIANVVRLIQSDLALAGRITFDARVTGTAENPLIRGAVALDDGRYGTAQLPDLRATLDYANETLATRALLTRRDDSTATPIATAEGTIPINLAFSTDAPRLPDRPLRLDVDADSLPLGILGQVSDLVTNVDGSAAGAVRVRGTTSDPEFVGALTLSRATARIEPAGVTLHDINGRLRLVGDTVLVDSLVAYNSGRILVRGGIGIAQPTQPSFDLYLVARNATVLDTELGRVRADAGLSMRGPFDNVYVSGATTITEGVIYIPEPDGKSVVGADDPALFQVIDTAVVAERALVPQGSPLLDNLRVDVTLGIDRDTWVRSADANVEIYTPEDLGPLEVSLDQRRQQIALRGVVSTERGEYTFLSKRFQVDRGSVIFTGSGEINPLLQITGLYEVRLPAQKALTIRVLIGGTLNSPQLSLESDAQPPLPQSDLISYLAFGRTSSSLLQLEGSALGSGGGTGGPVGAVAAVATQRLGAIGLGVLVDQLEGTTARSLGADVVNITPAELTIEASNPFNNLDALVRGTEFEIGRYFNRRTFVSFTVRPTVFAFTSSSQSIPGIRLQHRFFPGLQLETSFESRYLPQQPTLETDQQSTSTGVFGLFLIREWGW